MKKKVVKFGVHYVVVSFIVVLFVLPFILGLADLNTSSIFYNWFHVEQLHQTSSVDPGPIKRSTNIGFCLLLFGLSLSLIVWFIQAEQTKGNEKILFKQNKLIINFVWWDIKEKRQEIGDVVINFVFGYWINHLEIKKEIYSLQEKQIQAMVKGQSDLAEKIGEKMYKLEIG